MASEDVRKARQERADQNRRKALPAKAGKRIIIVLVLVAAIAGVVYAVKQNAETSRNCPGHWHATFGVFIDGERVEYPQPPYVLNGKLSLAMHMHSPSQEILHFEPVSPECLSTKDTFEMLDTDLSASRIKLTGDHGALSGTYATDENNTLRYFVQPRGEALRETAWADVGKRQLQDGEKLLVAYGTYSDAEIQSMMGRISTPPAPQE